MMTSFRASRGVSSSTVLSTNAAGTINHAVRGGLSLAAKSFRDIAFTAPSFTTASRASGFLSKTTHWCPPRMRRRTIFAPIRPRPTIPSCIRPLFELRNPNLREHAADYGVEFRQVSFDVNAEVNPQSAALPIRQHLKIPARLRCLHDAERVLLSRYR